MKFEVEWGKKEHGSLLLFGDGVLVSHCDLIDRVNLSLNYLRDIDLYLGCLAQQVWK